MDIEYFYRRYGPMVLRRCRSLLGNEEDAVEAMQEVFVRVIERADQLTDDAPSSLLYRIATHICLNRIRSKRRKPEHPQGELLFLIATAPRSEQETHARGLLTRLFKRHPDSTQTIAVLHWLDGMTLAEVAHEVGMSVSGVRKRLRALQADLRQMQSGEPLMAQLSTQELN